MLKNRKHIKSSLIFAFALQLSSCIEKDTVFEINDVTKQQHFRYVTHTNKFDVWKEVTIEGRINGCAEIAYFYYGHDSSAITNKKEWPKYTMIFQDSVSFKNQTEEGENARHGFIFIPGDATEGRITIRIRTL